jgi:protein-S-isoprenylcysteine O-methyltransferase Ste14
MYFFIISIISIVGAGFGILVCGIIFVVALALAGNSSSFDNAYDYDMAVTTSGILIIISLILFAVLIFNLITAILQTKFFNAPMKSMKSTNMVVTGKAYGVMNIINSVFNFIFAIAMALFGAIFLFFNDIENYASEFFTANSLSSIGILLIVIAFILVLSGVENILYGKLGFGYYKMASAVPRQPENNFNNYNGYNQQNYNNYNQPVQPQQPYGYNNYNQGYGQPEEAPQNPPQEQYNDNYNPYQQ